MRRLLAIGLVCLLGAAMPFTVGCKKKTTPPPMPQAENPVPGPGASAQEVERYQLEEEKRSLTDKYGENIGRIQQINARLIQLNIEINRQANPHY
ncbi:hypothetical protein DFW101_0600 [Solidesulfovibrio carbinoliphilus subsp. oakridgensis]|uniref:Lipoprotein n=1 Tax=Solidesulfovibrio carbinoliphilus subsp. oakridgensis TaxID=694327 RepID=G7QDW1_9BACT|nr:hypothetical protein [Solidesulfovibrio carbinoliphilus]EHJ46617.1 hypothetical protein DFW101_0600 [Solidesulfovibrio carbinoliphilus subsp. oakridgensis]